MKKSLSNIKFATWTLRIGLAFVFIYAGVSSLQHPLVWVGFLPPFLTKYVPDLTLITIIAWYELALAAWLLVGKFVRYSALLSFLTLAGIILADPSDLFISFRDIGLAAASLALFFLDS